MKRLPQFPEPNEDSIFQDDMINTLNFDQKLPTETD